VDIGRGARVAIDRQLGETETQFKNDLPFIKVGFV
jgi:hypothetical protein